MKLRTFVLIAALAAIVAAPATANVPLMPPANVMAAFATLHQIDTLDGLPPDIRSGKFTLPSGKALGGWVLAAPGGAWNATDVVTDPSLPGRRLHFAGCSASICVLHYERGGIAHIHEVVTLVEKNGTWKATWMAYGQPAMKDLAAVHALLENRSSANYSDQSPADVNY
ncbi:MAG TPA: hypothetical protein VK760_07485 [Candidatus Acidoferrales bacterium]|jgi:hypothetical protein|nr:hypothetical protein [Candidatus Acidoferrales bacterium]